MSHLEITLFLREEQYLKHKCDFEKYELKYDGKGVIFLFDLCCKGGNKVFDHQVKFEEEVEPAENYDGVKSSLLFDSIEFNYRENSKSDN